jgi:hypothetical protein
MRDLLATHGETWATAATDLGLTWWFERGFLAVRVRAEQYVQRGWAEQPLPGEIMFLQFDEVGPHLADPRLDPRDVVALSLARNELDGPRLRQWVTTPRSTRVQTLVLSETNLGPGMAPVFRNAEHGAFTELRRLDLALNPLTDVELQNFVQLADLPALRELILYSTELTSKGMPALAESAVLRQLTYLDLSFNELGDAGLRALMQAPDLSNLRTLRLKSNYISVNGLEALLAAPTLTQLQHLELVRNRFDVPWRGLHCGGVPLDTVVDPTICARLHERWPGLVVW